MDFGRIHLIDLGRYSRNLRRRSYFKDLRGLSYLNMSIIYRTLCFEFEINCIEKEIALGEMRVLNSLGGLEFYNTIYT